MFSHKPLIACFLFGSLPALALAQTAATQTGNDNEIILEQNGWNSASQVQQGDRNYSRVRQDGGDNRVQTNQLNLDNWTEVVQNGSSNQASVIQIGDIYSGHSASIVQLGTDNLAEVSQMDGNGAQANIHQEGAGNVHRVTQLYYMNEADSRSVGTNNLTEISQEWAGSARTDQLGNDNRITIEQGFLPYGGLVSVYQDGGSNEAAVNQQGGRYYVGQVELRQLGSANRAQVTQWAGFSSFTFTQEGSGNELNARQATRDGIIRGNTVGNDNRVNIDQSYDSPVCWR